jgi:hypothetical protein
MTKHPNRIAEVYGYLICLVSVIAILITSGGIIQALIDIGHPYQSREFNTQSSSLVSFDNYILTKRQASWTDTISQKIIGDTVTLRSMYEAERKSLVEKVNHRIRRDIVVNSSLLFLSVLLFVFHWLWLKNLFSTEI